MQSVRSNGGYLKICTSLTEQRKGILILCSSAPCFLAVNSVGSWFNCFLRSGNQKHRGIIPICYDGHTKPF